MIASDGYARRTQKAEPMVLRTHSMLLEGLRALRSRLSEQHAAGLLLSAPRFLCLLDVHPPYFREVLLLQTAVPRSTHTPKHGSTFEAVSTRYEALKYREESASCTST